MFDFWDCPEAVWNLEPLHIYRRSVRLESSDRVLNEQTLDDPGELMILVEIKQLFARVGRRRAI